MPDGVQRRRQMKNRKIKKDEVFMNCNLGNTREKERKRGKKKGQGKKYYLIKISITFYTSKKSDIENNVNMVKQASINF